MAEKEVTLNPNDLVNLLTYYQDVQGKDPNFLKAKVKESKTKLLNQRIDKYKESYGLTPDASKLTPRTNFHISSFPSDMENMVDVLNYLEYANELAGNKPIDYTQLSHLGSVLNLVKDAKYTPDELSKIYTKYMDNYKKFKPEIFSLTGGGVRNTVSSWLQGKEPSNLYEGDEYADYAKNITDLGAIPSKEQWLRDTVLKSNLPDNIQRYGNFQDNPEEVARAFKDIINSAETPAEEQQVNTPIEAVPNVTKKDAYTIGMEALNKNKDRYVQLGWWD